MSKRFRTGRRGRRRQARRVRQFRRTLCSCFQVKDPIVPWGLGLTPPTPPTLAWITLCLRSHRPPGTFRLT